MTRLTRTLLAALFLAGALLACNWAGQQGVWQLLRGLVFVVGQ